MAFVAQEIERVVVLEVRTKRQKCGRSIVDDNMAVFRLLKNDLHQVIEPALIDVVTFHDIQRLNAQFFVTREGRVDRISIHSRHRHPLLV